jgi:hypothetical protein
VTEKRILEHLRWADRLDVKGRLEKLLVLYKSQSPPGD